MTEIRERLEEDFLKAVRRLVVCARTTGGTAGPDQGLMDACETVEDMLRTHSPEEPEMVLLEGWVIEGSFGYTFVEDEPDPSLEYRRARLGLYPVRLALDGEGES